jgi:hypothetical protein
MCINGCDLTESMIAERRGFVTSQWLYYLAFFEPQSKTSIGVQELEESNFIYQEASTPLGNSVNQPHISFSRNTQGINSMRLMF